MPLRSFIFLLNAMLLNAGFLLSYLFRYGWPWPQKSFLPYENSFIFLTLIYQISLAIFGVYKKRYKSSWELFKRTFIGLFIGTLLSVAFIYVFRIKWEAFPSTIFIISFFVNLLLLFKFDQYILRLAKRIRKKVVVIGKGDVKDFISKRSEITYKQPDQITELIKYKDVDEIIISEQIKDPKQHNFLLQYEKNTGAEIIFTPAMYIKLISDYLTNGSSYAVSGTIFGNKSDVDEFIIFVMDITMSAFLIFLTFIPMLFIGLIIRITSRGPVIYKQQRVGKNGKFFTIYKFRTMVKDAERISGFAPATSDDPRITKFGRFLRDTRLDELPQLINILLCQMSFVGPRPENTYRVSQHKALQGLRLSVKPGLTGLAQVRSAYDLQPTHKIKYDYLYIQRRSVLLNLYILAKTIPVVLLKKGQ